MAIQIARVAGLLALAVVFFGLLSAAMFYVPGSPQQRALEQMRVLHQLQHTPEEPAAIAAVNAFLELGRKGDMLESTIVAAVTGLVVGLVPFSRRVTRRHLLLVGLGFVVSRLLLRGEALWEPLLWIGGLCLFLGMSAAVWLRPARREVTAT